jgi:hypothetical protein
VTYKLAHLGANEEFDLVRGEGEEGGGIQTLYSKNTIVYMGLKRAYAS